MIKPNAYDETNVGYTPIEPGGHKCVLHQIEEKMSSKGGQMLVLRFDTDTTDAQPNYYKARLVQDRKKNGENAKWKGVMYISTSGEYGVANLKRFVTAVEDSNPGLKAQWDRQPGDGTFVNWMRGKKVGIVFRKEEYEYNGKTGWSVKPMRFCDYNKAMTEKVPEPKTLNKASEAPGFTPSSDPQMAQEGFYDASQMSLDDPSLPFN